MRWIDRKLERKARLPRSRKRPRHVAEPPTAGPSGGAGDSGAAPGEPAWERVQDASQVIDESLPIELQYVGFAGKPRALRADFLLGVGRLRIDPEKLGLRLLLWDAAFGYISGFRKRDIAYFLFTRSWSRTVWHIAYWRENPDGGACSRDCRRCARRAL